MNCRDFEEIVVQLARGEAKNASALEHAAACAHCAARLASERHVTEALRAYAASSADAGAPERLEGVLLTAFRRTRPAQPVRRTAPQWRAWASALAAGVAVLAVAVGLQPWNPARSGAPAAVEQNEVATEYFPLDYGTDLSALEGAPVVRVELPRTVAASFGLPINPERAAEPVKADLLVGWDGVARAVRFVQ